MPTKFEREIKEVEEKIILSEKSLANTIKKEHLLRRVSFSVPKAFQMKDIIQQIIGAWLILVPLTHFEEIFRILPVSLPIFSLIVHITVTFFLAVVIIYYNNFPEVKRDKLLGIPFRFFSLFIVCIFSTLFVMLIYIEQIEHPFKLFLFLLGFALLGASTADSIG